MTASNLLLYAYNLHLLPWQLWQRYRLPFQALLSQVLNSFTTHPHLNHLPAH